MPLIAIVNGARARALRDGPRRGQCADCGQEMLARTGEVVTWHWAHREAEEERTCHTEPETEWHLAWKARCGDPQRVEVSVGARRADVLTPYRWAVEFQHSSLEVGEVRARERDWRRCLIWVIDAARAYAEDRLRIWRPEGRAHWTVEWAWAPAWVREPGCRMFLDLDGDRVMLLGRWFEKSPDRPVKGYGWLLSVDDVARCVLDGRRPPKLPVMGQHLDPGTWSAAVVQVDCPDCGRPLADEPPKACAAATFHRLGVAA